MFMCGPASLEPSVSMSFNSVESNDKTQEILMKHWRTGLILSGAAFLIISTNLLVAAALLRLVLKKGSQSWCFLLNLAVADTLVGVAITGLATEDLMINNGTQHPWNDSAQGKNRCLVRIAFVASPCTASIMSMVLISLDRYAAIKTPLRYTRLSGKGTAIVSLLVLWVFAPTVGFLPVMVRQMQTNNYKGFCTLFSVVHQMGIIVLFTCCFFPLLSVFVYIYLDILKISYRHQKHIYQIRQAGCRTIEEDQEHEQQHNQQRNCFTSHFKALKMVAVLVGCLLLLWCPFFVACLVQLACKSCKITELLESYLWLLGLSNSLINPLVYACWQREVRLQLAAMFSCFTHRLSAAGPKRASGKCNQQPPALSPVAISVRGIHTS